MLWKTSKKLAAQTCPVAENFEKLVRRVTLLLVGTGLLVAILTVGVTGYTFYRINRAVTEVSEPLAPLVPLVRGITNPLQGSEKSNGLKKTWGILKQDQVKTFKKLKDKMGKYSYRQAKKIESGFEKLTEWWGSQKNQRNEGGI